MANRKNDMENVNISLDVNTVIKQLLFHTVKIKTDKSTGTGFFYQEKVDGKTIVFIVTNKHVVKDSDYGELVFQLKENDKPALGQITNFKLKNFKKLWFDHPDKDVDVCVMPITEFIDDQEVFDSLFFRAVSDEFIPSFSELQNLDYLEDIIFVGYPDGLSDEINNIPLLRKGITSTPIHIDYENKPLFLIDGSVFGGSSGSPVFLYHPGPYRDINNNLINGNKFYFLGVLTAVFQKSEGGSVIRVESSIINDLQAVITQYLDIGVVFKARTIRETIANIDFKLEVKRTIFKGTIT